MFQLVGYRSWNAARDAQSIDTDAIRKGVEIASEELASRVYDATAAELSPGDLSFLAAMNGDGSPTNRGDIVKRTGRSSSWVSTYRRRLLEAGVLAEVRQGVYSYALPGFAEYLAKQHE